MRDLELMLNDADAEAASRDLVAALDDADVELTARPLNAEAAARLKTVDPVAVTALALSIPAAVLAVLDLADRIAKRRRAKKLIEAAGRIRIEGRKGQVLRFAWERGLSRFLPSSTASASYTSATPFRPRRDPARSRGRSARPSTAGATP